MSQGVLVVLVARGGMSGGEQLVPAPRAEWLPHGANGITTEDANGIAS